MGARASTGWVETSSRFPSQGVQYNHREKALWRTKERHVLVDKLLVRGIGTLSGIGAAIFLAIGLPLIALYLALAGAAFWGFSLGWKARHERVLDEPPPGWRPTGERYPNPGGPDPVEVWFSGIRRVYVRRSSQAEESPPPNR